MSFAEDTSELDDGLHSLDLTFNDCIEVFFFDLREKQEVYRPRISSFRIFRNEGPERLVDVFGQERCVG